MNLHPFLLDISDAAFFGVLGLLLFVWGTLAVSIFLLLFFLISRRKRALLLVAAGLSALGMLAEFSARDGEGPLSLQHGIVLGLSIVLYLLSRHNK